MDTGKGKYWSGVIVGFGLCLSCAGSQPPSLSEVSPFTSATCFALYTIEKDTQWVACVRRVGEGVDRLRAYCGGDREKLEGVGAVYCRAWQVVQERVERDVGDTSIVALLRVYLTVLDTGYYRGKQGLNFYGVLRAVEEALTKSKDWEQVNTLARRYVQEVAEDGAFRRGLDTLIGRVIEGFKAFQPVQRLSVAEKEDSKDLQGGAGSGIKAVGYGGAVRVDCDSALCAQCRQCTEKCNLCVGKGVEEGTRLPTFWKVGIVGAIVVVLLLFWCCLWRRRRDVEIGEGVGEPAAGSMGGSEGFPSGEQGVQFRQSTQRGVSSSAPGLAGSGHSRGQGAQIGASPSSLPAKENVFTWDWEGVRGGQGVGSVPVPGLPSDERVRVVAAEVRALLDEGVQRIRQDLAGHGERLTAVEVRLRELSERIEQGFRMAERLRAVESVILGGREVWYWNAVCCAGEACYLTVEDHVPPDREHPPLFRVEFEGGSREGKLCIHNEEEVCRRVCAGDPLLRAVIAPEPPREGEVSIGGWEPGLVRVDLAQLGRWKVEKRIRVQWVVGSSGGADGSKMQDDGGEGGHSVAGGSAG